MSFDVNKRIICYSISILKALFFIIQTNLQKLHIAFFMLRRTFCLKWGICLMLINFCFWIFDNEPYFAKAKQNLSDCVQAEAKTHYNFSTLFFQKFAECINKYIPISISKLDLLNNEFYDEKKVFVPMNIKYNQTKCKWLTVGIGGSAIAEKNFKQMYPQCKLYGVEPGESGNFSTIGTLLPYGVGPVDAEIRLQICQKYKARRNRKITFIKNGYKEKNVTVFSLKSLMDRFVGSRLMHYLTIDIEGLEYSVLETLIGNGTSAAAGVRFCQIDAELHNPNAPNANSIIKNFNPVQFILNFVNEKSPYLPIFNVPYQSHPHQKVTFINVVDPECERAFRFSQLFES